MPRHYRSDSTSPAAAERRLECSHYEFLKSILYRLYTGDVRDEDVAVSRFMAVTDGTSFRMKPVSVSDDMEGISSGCSTCG